METSLTELGFSYEWLEEDMLHYWFVNVGVRQHPRTGDLIWSNQVSQCRHLCIILSQFNLQSSVCHGSYYTHLPDSEDLGYVEDRAPSHTFHQDGTPLTQTQLNIIRRAQWTHCRAIQWRQGDLLVS